MKVKPVLPAFNFKSLVLFAISIGLLWYTISNSGLQWQHLRLSTPQWGYLLLACGVLLFTVWVQSVRVQIPWQPVLKQKKPDTLNGLMIGNFYNCILPGNLGEAIRAWHFSRKNNVSFIKALAAQGVEKYIDALNFFLYTVLLMVLFFNMQNHFKVIFWMSVMVAFVFLLYLLIIYNKRVERLMMRVLLSGLKAGKWLYKLHYNIKGMLLAMNKRQIADYLLLGYLMFALNVLQYYLAMLVAGMSPEMATAGNAFLVAVAMVIVYILPSAPGNTGVVHYGIYALLLSVAKAKGIAGTPALLQSLALYSIYLHLSYFVPEVAAGALVLIREKRWILR